MDDPRLKRFVLQERQKVKMQEHVNELTERSVLEHNTDKVTGFRDLEIKGTTAPGIFDTKVYSSVQKKKQHQLHI